MYESAPLQAESPGTSKYMRCMRQVPSPALLYSARKPSSQRRAHFRWPSRPLGEYFEGCAGQNPGPVCMNISSRLMEKGGHKFAPLCQQVHAENICGLCCCHIREVSQETSDTLACFRTTPKSTKTAQCSLLCHSISHLGFRLADSYRPPQVFEFALVGLCLDIMQVDPPVVQVFVLL
jgi:hypothetical protein